MSIFIDGVEYEEDEEVSPKEVSRGIELREPVPSAPKNTALPEGYELGEEIPEELVRNTDNIQVADSSPQVPVAPPAPEEPLSWIDAIFPGSSKEAKKGDPNWWKTLGKSTGDVLSLPGRAATAAIDAGATNLAGAMSGRPESEYYPDVIEAAKLGLSGKIQEDDPWYRDVAASTLKDPMLAPSMAAGYGIMKAPINVLGKLLLGVGAGVGAGALTRGYNDEKILDPIPAAIDAGASFIPGGLDFINAKRAQGAAKAAKEALGFLPGNGSRDAIEQIGRQILGTPDKELASIAKTADRVGGYDRALSEISESLPIEGILDDIRGGIIPPNRYESFRTDEAMDRIAKIAKKFGKAGDIDYAAAGDLQRVLLEAKAKAKPRDLPIYDEVINSIDNWRLGKVDANLGNTRDVAQSMLEIETPKIKQGIKAKRTAGAGSITSLLDQDMKKQFKGQGLAFMSNMARRLTEGEFRVMQSIMAKDEDKRTPAENQWLEQKISND